MNAFGWRPEAAGVSEGGFPPRHSAPDPLRVCHQLVAKHRAAMTRADLAELLRHRRRVEGDGDSEHSRDCLLNNCVMIVEMHEELLDRVLENGPAEIARLRREEERAHGVAHGAAHVVARVVEPLEERGVKLAQSSSPSAFGSALKIMQSERHTSWRVEAS